MPPAERTPAAPDLVAPDQIPLRPTGIVLSDDRSAVVLQFVAAPDGEDTVSGADGDWLPATLAMGEGGRMLDLEVPGGDGDGGPLDIEVSPWPGGAVRHVPVLARLSRLASGDVATITIPRRGAGYEITYPSGNQ